MRLIDADELLSEIEDHILMSTVSHYLTVSDCKAAIRGMEEIKKIAEEAPTIDAVPVVHAHWKFLTDYSAECNKCGKESFIDHDNEPPYCQFCAAMMDEKDGE